MSSGSDPGTGAGTSYSFFPVARRGGAAAIPDTSPDAMPSGPLSARASPGLGLVIQATNLDGSTSDFTAAPGNLITPSGLAATGLQLYGPGDVTGFDTRHVVRTEPADGTPNFESTYFAGIEFDDPDIPWMFTPAQAVATEDGTTLHARLHPWIVLVVLADGEYTLTPAGQAGGLATVTVDVDAVAQLPDLAQSWQWAHVQLTGSLNGSSLDSVFQSTPERLVSRLLGPRCLSPDTSYSAFLVPAFDAGVSAGLNASGSGGASSQGASSPPTVVNLAWSTTAQQPVTLPVYYSFSFGTGDAGDFKSLALRLAPMPLANVGQRPMSVDDPRNQGSPWSLPPITTDGSPLQLGGALQSPEMSLNGWNTNDETDFQSALQNLLNLAGAPVSDDPNQPDPVVVPPIYGRYHADVSSVTEGDDDWVDVLNLDPRLRAAAGLGAQVVTAERSQLMASAWRQISGVELANRILRQAQLNRASLQQTYQQTFEAIGSISLLILTANVQGRVLLSGQTAYSSISQSKVPWRIFGAGVRRLTRPRGPWRRRQGQMGRSIDQLVTGLSDGSLAIIGPAPAPSGAVAFNSQHGKAFQAIGAAPPPSGFVFKPPIANEEEAATEFREWIIKLGDLLAAVPSSTPPTQPDFEGIASGVLGALDPTETVPARALSLVTAQGWTPQDPIEPIMAAPNFPQPMYAPLRDISQQLLLPGIGQVPADSVGLLEPNRAFIESYMVGLNFEMARQLLWNAYPTDQRGSYFRQFWDPTSSVPSTASPGGASSGSSANDPDTTYDIAPIHEWTQPLGENVNPANSTPVGVVLVVRGELLRRYPTTIIYASPAANGQPPTADAYTQGVLNPSPDGTYPEIYPLFRGSLSPDLTYVAFNLNEEEALTGAFGYGYFFVLQQHPTEPRFGPQNLPSPLPGDSASIASAAFVEPFRVAIHASLMVLPTVSSIAPASGLAAGGTPVTVNGTGFNRATSVSFGTTLGTALTVVSDIELTVTSPAGTAGDSVDVTVTAPSGTSPTNPDDLFSYQ